jgi:hypothetical protein
MPRRRKSGRKSFFEPQPVAPQPYYPYPPDGMPVPVSPSQGSVPSRLQVDLEILGDGDATVAKATLNTTAPYSKILEVKRSSRRMPGDRYDEEIGTLYAAARALHAVAGKMQKHADALAKHAESSKKESWHVAEIREDGPRVHIVLPDGVEAAEVPDFVEDTVRKIFPHAEVSYSRVEDMLPPDVVEQIEDFLKHPENSVRRGRHEKQEAEEENPAES